MILSELKESFGNGTSRFTVKDYYYYLFEDTNSGKGENLFQQIAV